MTNIHPSLKRGIPMLTGAVRGILEGAKTQIRTLPRIQPEARGDGYYFDAYCSEAKTPVNPRGMSDEWCWWTADHRPALLTMLRCPHGQPGDRLWVKEAWQTGRELDRKIPAEIGEQCLAAGYKEPWAPIRFVADGHKLNEDSLLDFGGHWGRERHARHLPRWASRLTLEIVEVRMQRLQEISEDDARAEGCHRNDAAIVFQHGVFDRALSWTARGAFAVAWDAINSKRRRREHAPLGEPGHGMQRAVVDESALWAANPWVWVIAFRRAP